MNFQETETKYKELRAQHSAGKLNDADFEAEVGKLRLQDAQGRWWQIGVQSGEWYVYDGQKWAKAHPPAPAAASPAPPPASPEEKPAPAAQKPARGGALPARLFSSKPAGRNGGGLPTKAVIGIVVAVAVICIAAVVGGYFLINNQFKGIIAGLASPTPTRVTVVPSPVIPTLGPPPTLRQTDTPLPPLLLPSPVVSATNTPVPATPGAVRPTPTRRPATPTTVPPTKPPAVPPGMYVTKLELDPPKPSFNETVGFRLTLYNNGDFKQGLRWRVLIYQCSDQGCTVDHLRKSIGESTTVTSDIGVGTVEVTAPKHWAAGVGACNFAASPHYLDANSQLVPFLKTDGKQMYFDFSLCR